MKKIYVLILFLFIFLMSANAQDSKSFNDRRESVMKGMENGVCLIYAKDNKNELNNNFYYLTGLRDTSAILLLCPNHQPQSMIFTRKYKNIEFMKTEKMAIYPLSDFARQSFRLIANTSRLWVSFIDLGRIQDFWFLVNSKKGILNYEILLYKLREIKDANEQKLIKKAVDITANTLKEVFVLLKDGMIENDILKIIDKNQKAKGADETSFMQAGSGVNGTQVHAEPSDKAIRDGELIVFDVGAYYENYTSDISRTVPVNGKFTKAQKQIYTIVLDAQKAAIEKMLAGVSMREVQKIVEDKLTQGLFDIGLITDINNQWQRSLYLIHPYYHYIGLDIHDYYSIMAAELDEKKYLVGSVMTMEPGLYFPPNLLDQKPQRAGNLSNEEFESFVQKTRPVFNKYKNIGVRIEDDILITKEGNVVLSASLPKEIKDIERMMKAK